MLDLSRLSPEQRQAVLAGDGPLLIQAGPGSGKTTVLAARIAYLVIGRRVPPHAILAITFATKAARELRARLLSLLGDQGNTVDVATFHAFGLRILRQWSQDLGFGPGPLVVYDEADARHLLHSVVQDLGIETRPHTLADLASALARYRLGDTPRLPLELLQPLTEAYETALQRRGAVDFVAMLALPLRLFDSHPEALSLYQDAYQYILVDEFQDVCAAQYRLLCKLAQRRHNLTVVGDPCQTLYGWRGANARFLLDFRRDFPDTRVLGLHTNYRSTGHIVDLANALGAPLAHRHPLHTHNPKGTRPYLHVASDERAEAAFVVAEVVRLQASGHLDHPGEVGILYRTNRQAWDLTLALRARHLPYHVRGRGDLFARREVRDAMAYLRLAYNPTDSAALVRIVNAPLRCLGRVMETVDTDALSLQGLADLACPLGGTALREAEALAELVHHLHENRRLSPALLLDLALDRSGYRAWLATQSDGEERLLRLAELRGLLARADGDLPEWLAGVSIGDEPDEVGRHEERIVLTSIHGAKGREWRVVFVTGVEEGLLPHTHALLDSDDETTALDAERQLAYVAVTRPRERLYLSYCRSRQRGDRAVVCQPSRFLRGLPLDTRR